ncbi:MAG: hypothetical protein M3Y17_03450 [Actinomycetota bacterium]|nr:hypothetical protein [Actinomycetota bacterium]
MEAGAPVVLAAVLAGPPCVWVEVDEPHAVRAEMLNAKATARSTCVRRWALGGPRLIKFMDEGQPSWSSVDTFSRRCEGEREV